VPAEHQLTNDYVVMAAAALGKDSPCGPGKPVGAGGRAKKYVPGFKSGDKLRRVAGTPCFLLYFRLIEYTAIFTFRSVVAVEARVSCAALARGALF
jgi:hypothetical protein